MASTKEDLKTEDKLAPKDDEVVEKDENSSDEGDDDQEDKGAEEDEETDEGDDEDESDDSEADEEDEEDDSGESEFKKRFTQIKGDTPDEYLENLENTYLESSSEGVRLSQENKDFKEKLDTLVGAITSDKELAAQVEAKIGKAQAEGIARDPAIDYARSNVEAQWKQEWNDFSEVNPDVVTNPELSKRVVETLQALSETVAKTEKRTLGMKEGLDMVAGIMKLNQVSKEDKVRMAAKGQAQGKTVSGSSDKRAKPTSGLTDAQLKFAKRMGYSEDQVRKFNK